MKLTPICVAVSIAIISAQSLAVNNAAYRQGAAFASGNVGKSASALKGFNPTNTFKHYSAHPSQTGLYTTLANGDTQLESAANKVLVTSSTGQGIEQHFVSGPRFGINPNSPGMKKGRLIVNDAYDIANSISDAYVNCRKRQVNCHATYTDHTCVSGNVRHAACTKTLQVKVYYPKLGKCYHLTGPSDDPSLASGPGADHMCVVGFFNAGVGGGNQNITRSFNETILLPPGRQATMVLVRDRDDGAYVSGNTHLGSNKLSVNDGGGFEQHTVSFIPKTNSNTMHVYYHLQRPDGGGFSRIFGYVKYAYLSGPIVTKKWVSQCDGLQPLIRDGYCKVSTPERCSLGAGTHIINHTPISESCWAYQTNYVCGDTSVNTCQNYINRGCTQIGSTCTEQHDGICFKYQNTYECSNKTCTGSGVVCGGDFFCTKGKCVAPHHVPSHNFNKAIAGLAGVASGGTSYYNSQGVTIFEGHSMSCNDDAAGFSNCCNGSGWGKNIHLAHCTSEEKQLGMARENNLAIGVGEYCSHKVLGICLQHRKSFCVFGSMLGKIIQNQGRGGQLSISFGKASSPNCSGISPQQLSRINFNKINFSAVYQSMEKNMHLPSGTSVSAAIKQRIEDYFNNGFAN